MMHIHYFITRKASMNDAEFHRYWRETHGPIAAKIPQLHRYVQSHRIRADDRRGASPSESWGE